MTNDHHKLWEDCKEVFRNNVSPEQYKVWFESLSCVSYQDRKLVLAVPSAYYIDHLEERFSKLIGYTLCKVFGPGVELSYRYNVVQNDPGTSVTMRDTRPSQDVKPRPGATSNPFVSTETTEIHPQLNPRYTFENYCYSHSNQIAHNIAEKIAKDPHCKTFNPLFVFGAPGVGKTHLIQAIGIRIKELRPETRVLYITARLFETQYTTAVRQGKVNEFINFYQSIEVLIIDDIQDLTGKSATQRAFFHIFNHLHQNSRQLVMSCDSAPSALEGMEERMLSRFKWGMTAQLDRPDYELRMEVLKLRAAQDGLEIPEDVLRYIATNVTDSIRELEGIVVSLLAHATVLGCELDIPLAKRVLANAVKVREHQINFEQIAQQVSAFYNIKVDQIFTKTRKREVSDARQIVMYLAKKHANMSLIAIGHRLDRSHATVLHGCNTIEQRIAMEKQLKQDIESIESAMAADAC